MRRIEALDLFLRGWGNYFRTGNAADKFTQLDRYVAWRLKRLLIKKRGRNLRVGQAERWTRTWFHDQGLHQLIGTIRYPRERRIAPPDPPTYLAEYDQLTLARLLVAEGAARQALHLLDRVLAVAQAAGRDGSLVEARLVRALATTPTATRTRRRPTSPTPSPTGCLPATAGSSSRRDSRWRNCSGRSPVARRTTYGRAPSTCWPPHRDHRDRDPRDRRHPHPLDPPPRTDSASASSRCCACWRPSSAGRRSRDSSSRPPPEPRSSTRSPGCSSATATGLPHAMLALGAPRYLQLRRRARVHRRTTPRKWSVVGSIDGFAPSGRDPGQTRVARHHLNRDGRILCSNCRSALTAATIHHSVSSTRSGRAGADRPMTTSAAVGKHATHSSLTR